MADLIGLRELKTLHFWTCLLTELIGTILLIMFACGTGVVKESCLHQAIAVGVTVAVLVWSIAHVSGCHINPAVSLAFLSTRKISLMRAIFYIITQCIGGIVGAAAAFSLSSAHARNSEVTKNEQALESVKTPSTIQVIGIEFLISFVLLLSVFATIDDRRKGFVGSGPVVIGLAIVMGHVWAVPLTGAVTNPAGAFGVAVVKGDWTLQWAYWLGEVGGGVAAAILYDLVFAVNASLPKIKSFFTDLNYNDARFNPPGEASQENDKHELSVQTK